jgi:hypothetical protein
MNNKLTWEDIVPKPDESLYKNEKEYLKGILDFRHDVLNYYIPKAEAEGKVCLNPPSEEELYSIIDKYLMTGYYSDLKYAAQEISKRLRGEI